MAQATSFQLRLEEGNGGARFPLLMGKLYQGSLSSADANAAIREAQAIKRGLQKLGRDRVVWDFEVLSPSPPWGKTVGPHVRSMTQYFVTSTGRNLVDEILDGLESRAVFGGTLDIISYDRCPFS